VSHVLTLEPLARAKHASYRMGRFTVRAVPLADNRFMLRYVVSAKGKEIGRQLSVPTLADCERMANPPVYAAPRFIHYNGARGRPRKDAPKPGYGREYVI
jgi:hypothetical protein